MINMGNNNNVSNFHSIKKPPSKIGGLMNLIISQFGSDYFTIKGREKSLT